MDILIREESGEMIYLDKWEAGVFTTHGIVHQDNPTRKALDIGRKMLALAGVRKMREPELVQWGTGKEADAISITLDIPEPLTGLAYLKSLPIGTRILGPISKTRVVIDRMGVFIMDRDEGYNWLKWEELGGNWYAASADTCTEWTPEENKDDQ